MSIEITAPDEATDAQPPPPPPVASVDSKVPVDPKDKTKLKAKERDDDSQGEHTRRSAQGGSAEMKALRSQEDQTLKELIQGFGTEGSYKIKISRKDPESVRDATGKMVSTVGHLDTVEKAIDEDWIKEKYGGGTYELIFRRRSDNGGYLNNIQRTIKIAGEPNLGELPRSVIQTPGAVIATSASDANPTIVKDAFAFMKDQVTAADARNAQPRGPDPMFALIQEELREARRQNTDLAKELREIATRPAPVSTEDKFKDKYLEKLIDGDSARISAVRVQYESELRQAKEAAIENEKRLYDRFERDKQSFENSHKRELDLVNNSHATSLAAARASFETSLQAAKSSFDTQKEIMTAENRRLDRDNSELRVEVKDLRAKKEKSVIEQFKEIQVIKDAIGIEDGDNDKGIGEKLVDAITNPEAIAAVGQMFGKGQGQAAPPPATEAPAARPRVVQDRKSGQKYILSLDGKTLKPVQPKPVEGSTPGETLPNIDPAIVAQMVGYLERACTAGTDPAIVAQSAKPHVTEPILMAVRDMGGIDVFLSKMAKLPSSSPLSATQQGRNWVKKVGKALVGDAE